MTLKIPRSVVLYHACTTTPLSVSAHDIWSV